MAFVYQLLKNKWVPPTDHSDISFSGKTILVTGSNVGLGAEAAHKFAAQGAKRLILAVRSPDKGAAVQQRVQHVASDPTCKVDVWQLDLLDYASIRAFAARVESELDRLDIAVLNAGVYSRQYAQSAYGWERTLQVNTLSTAALALLLLPQLRKSKTEESTPVLELVNSGRHYVATFTKAEKRSPDEEGSASILDGANKAAAFGSGKAYRHSKLLLMYVAQSIAKLVQHDTTKPPEVFVPSVCPGACTSELARGYNSLPMKAVKFQMSMLALRTAEEGSRAYVSGTDVGEKGHGRFWQNDVVREPAPLLVGNEGEMLREKVWSEVLEALAKDMPEMRALAGEGH